MPLARNIIVFAVADLIAGSIGLLASPINTRLLTPEQYGAISLLAAVWAVVALLQFGGIDWAFPFFKAQKEYADRERDIIVTASIFSMLSLVVVWLVFGLITLSGSWLKEYAQINTIELILFLLALMPQGLVIWHLYVLRFKHLALPFVRITLLAKICGVVIAIPIMYVVPQENRLSIFFGALFLAQTIGALWTFYEFKKNNLPLYELRYWSFLLCRKMIWYGIFLVPGGAVYAMTAVADRLLVGWFSGPDQVAILSIAIALGATAIMLKNWFNLVWSPHLVEWIAQKKSDEYIHIMQSVLNILCVVFFSIALLSVFWTDLIVSVIYPPHYAPVGKLVPVFVLAGAFSVLSLVSSATALIAKTPRFHMPIYTIALLINCTVGFFLIPKYGALGAVLGTLFSECFIFFAWVVLGKYVLKNLPLQYWLTLIVITITNLIIIVYVFDITTFDLRIIKIVVYSLIITSICTYYLYLNRSNLQAIR